MTNNLMKRLTEAVVEFAVETMSITDLNEDISCYKTTTFLIKKEKYLPAYCLYIYANVLLRAQRKSVICEKGRDNRRLNTSFKIFITLFVTCYVNNIINLSLYSVFNLF